MSENTINNLSEIARRILEVLKDIWSDLSKSLVHLRQLPEYFKNLNDTINQSSNNQIQARGEMEIHIRMADIHAQKQHVLSENEVIEEFKKQLEEDILRVDERYRKIDDKLIQECDKRIMEMDAHLLNFPDSFPASFVVGVTEKVNPLVNEIMVDANVSYQERVQYLREKADLACRSIQEFLSTRNELLQKIQDYQQDDVPADEKEYHIPVWIVETEEVADGKKNKSLFFPGSFNGQGGENGMHFEVDKALAKIEETFNDEAVKERLIKEINWTSASDQKESLLTGIAKILSLKNEKKDSVTNAFNKILQSSPLMTIK